MVKTRCKTVTPRKCTYTLRTAYFRSKSFEKCSVFIENRFHHFRVATRCCFPFVPVRVTFSKSTVFQICRQRIYCFHLNERPIRHIFHYFQNVQALCERNLIFSFQISMCLMNLLWPEQLTPCGDKTVTWSISFPCLELNKSVPLLITCNISQKVFGFIFQRIIISGCFLSL